MSKGSGIFASITFCPKCGVESLQRDDYRRQGDKSHKNVNHAVEYICLTCGLGFYVAPSKRHQDAQHLFREHRQMRVGKD
jgi:hypothetical protein